MLEALARDWSAEDRSAERDADRPARMGSLLAQVDGEVVEEPRSAGRRRCRISATALSSIALFLRAYITSTRPSFASVP
jgi:hypothetical protein